MKKILARIGLALFGLLVGMAAVEVGLRLAYPDGGMPAAHLHAFSPEVLASFHEDPECGYLPVTDSGEYTAQGVVKNEYDLERKKGQRVLFCGDSVTHRGNLIRALRKVYGEDGYEYWNAGVESFNTLQELVLYRRYNHQIHPDHVVLTFHNNDFQATPLVVREKGHLKVYEPGMHINAFLFERSYLYRWAWPRTEHGDRNDRARQVLANLMEFRDLLARQKVRFSVVLFPVLKPFARWDEPERWSRQQALDDFKQLGLESYDLLNCLETALRDGVKVEESPDDPWHPSPAAAERFAEQLHSEGLLADKK